MTTIREINEDALLMDGFDDAVIGICYQFSRPPVAVYDLDKVLARLQDDGMSEEEAREFWEVNQVGAWMGEGTPVFFEPATVEEPDNEIRLIVSELPTGYCCHLCGNILGPNDESCEECGLQKSW